MSTIRAHYMWPAEEITMRWLMSKGYFVIANLKCGRRELDLIAIKLSDGKRQIARKVHVEVQVSSNPVGSRNAEEEAYRAAAEKDVERKFACVASKATAVLGEHYERWLVRGKLAGGDREYKLQKKRMEELDVRVYSFEEVVREYLKMLHTRPADYPGQLLHMLNAIGILNPTEEK